MKKLTAFLLVMLLSAFLLLSGCMPAVETITRQSGDYLYKENEKIQIVDIETDKVIAVLKITGVKQRKADKFLIPTYVGTDSNHSDIYQDVEYHQLLQITFDFQNEPTYSKNISGNNFSVSNSAGERAEINPTFKGESVTPDSDSFLAAFKQQSDTVTVKFTYDVFQFRHTAKITLHIPGVSAAASQQASSGSQPGSQSTFSSKQQVSSASVQTQLYTSQPVSSVSSEPAFSAASVTIIAVLAAVIVVLTVLLIAAKKKR